MRITLTRGGTRGVIILNNKYVIKIPLNIRGAMANLYEVLTWNTRPDQRERLCPVIYANSLFSISKWCRILNEQEYQSLPIEMHTLIWDSQRQNFGYDELGVLKCIDYGNGIKY